MGGAVAKDGAAAGDVGGERVRRKGGRGPRQEMPWRAALAARQWRNVFQGLRKDLADNPEDPELHATLGIVSARIGRYGEAVAAFSFAQGSPTYEGQGLSLHADALRATGDYQGAIALRRESFAAAERALRQSVVSLDLADDLRYAGDLLGAEQAALYVLAEAPRMEETYALLAEIALDVGDTDEAELNLWLADLYGHRTSRTRVARARLQIALGDLEAAYEEVSYGRMRNRNHLPWALQAEILRRQGFAVEGLYLLESGRLPDKDRPEMMAVRLACLASDGQIEEALELRAEAIGLYPRDPNVVAASVVVDKAVAKWGGR